METSVFSRDAVADGFAELRPERLVDNFVVETLLLLGLILLNGVFAMSEIAVVASRKARLEERAEKGERGARRALEMAQHPTRFLSTVQVGITLIGVFAGAYGGTRIAGRLGAYLEGFAPIAAYGQEIALAVVVAIITILSLILGELVPKRIALTSPDRIASIIAGPMHMLSLIAGPAVHALSAATDGLLRLVGIQGSSEPPVTEAEVAAMLEAGTKAGVFEEEEHELVERVFWLGDQDASSLMTPRHRIEWLDVDASPEDLRRRLVEHRFSRYLVCQGELDNVLGIIRVKDLLAELLEGKPLDIRAALRQPLYVPEGMGALRLLEMFRESGVRMAVVIDEYGGVDGLITLNDVLEEIAGSLAPNSEPRVFRREDGSWLVDGGLSMADFWDALGLNERRGDERASYNTLAGLVVTHLGRIPSAGDTFQALDLRFEVLDMDGHRVDKVLVSPVGSPAPASAD